ncbi:MAG: polysaccharide biosynthesis protein, partial [Bacteroidales bacterium]|nr:polysaccharide biosynthesis protein [Bacteroidales bacterium]
MLQDSDNKRVAKNSIMLYLRMLVTMVVGFYTSRVVLQVLGEEDFGVYGLVGGIVGMLSFLNTTMSGATSRFLTFELGKGNKSSLSSMFDSALIVHTWIAVI